MIFKNNTNSNVIKEAIVKTIAFFDMFDYPLTVFELWQFINIECQFREIEEVLNKGDLGDRIEGKQGFYFLTGRSKIIKTKMERYYYTNLKFKRALRVSRIFKFIPWIKMIAVSNIIGANNMKREGDIDLFIITEKNKTWLTRFFCASLMKLLGLRPKPGKEQDKICLNFFISEEAMDLQGLMLDNVNIGISLPGSDRASGNGRTLVDIYFIYWLAGLAPIYNKDNTYQKFIKANNSWVKEFLPNWQPVKVSNRRKLDSNFSKFYKDIIDLFIGGLEKDIKKLQLKLMPENLKRLINKDSRVVINDQVLKLHAKDRREGYREKWRQRIIDIELVKWTLR